MQKDLNKFDIAVFCEFKKRGDGIKCRAYSCWFNSNWSGCHMVRVDAKNGTEAKKKAIEIIKSLYEKSPESIKLSSD